MKGLAELLKKEYDKEDEKTKASYETRSNFLKTMNLTGYQMYAGTVPPVEVQRRRVKGKRQKASRRINRKANKR
jgi:hypothetical protein